MTSCREFAGYGAVPHRERRIEFERSEENQGGVGEVDIFL